MSEEPPFPRAAASAGWHWRTAEELVNLSARPSVRPWRRRALREQALSSTPCWHWPTRLETGL